MKIYDHVPSGRELTRATGSQRMAGSGVDWGGREAFRGKAELEVLKG